MSDKLNEELDNPEQDANPWELEQARLQAEAQQRVINDNDKWYSQFREVEDTANMQRENAKRDQMRTTGAMFRQMAEPNNNGYLPASVIPAYNQQLGGNDSKQFLGAMTDKKTGNIVAFGSVNANGQNVPGPIKVFTPAEQLGILAKYPVSSDTTEYNLYNKMRMGGNTAANIGKMSGLDAWTLDRLETAYQQQKARGENQVVGSNPTTRAIQTIDSEHIMTPQRDGGSVTVRGGIFGRALAGNRRSGISAFGADGKGGFTQYYAGPETNGQVVQHNYGTRTPTTEDERIQRIKTAGEIEAAKAKADAASTRDAMLEKGRNNRAEMQAQAKEDALAARETRDKRTQTAKEKAAWVKSRDTAFANIDKETMTDDGNGGMRAITEADKQQKKDAWLKNNAEPMDEVDTIYETYKGYLGANVSERQKAQIKDAIEEELNSGENHTRTDWIDMFEETAKQIKAANHTATAERHEKVTKSSQDRKAILEQAIKDGKVKIVNGKYVRVK